MTTQDFIIFGVDDLGDGRFKIKLGPESGDPSLSMDASKHGIPEVGDTVTVVLPEVVGLVKP
mgnify:CR=1 FL=1